MHLYQNRNLIVKGQSSEVGNLWLGDYESARNKRTLKADKINAVVTAGLGMKISYTSEIKHKMLPLYDSQAQDISRYFASCYQFIDDALKSGNVLIHCYAGVSRSVTILTAYLMKKNNWGSRQTLSMIKKIRFVIGPNRGFMNQLRKYEQNMESFGTKLSQSAIKQTTDGKSNSNIGKIKINQSSNSFVQGFLGYKRQNSLVNKNRSNIVNKNIKPQSRSKTLRKEVSTY